MLLDSSLAVCWHWDIQMCLAIPVLSKCFLAPVGMPICYWVGCSKQHFLLRGKEQLLDPTLWLVSAGKDKQAVSYNETNFISPQTEPVGLLLLVDVYFTENCCQWKQPEALTSGSIDCRQSINCHLGVQCIKKEGKSSFGQGTVQKFQLILL